MSRLGSFSFVVLWLCVTAMDGFMGTGSAVTTDVSYVAHSSQKLEQLVGDIDWQTGLPTLSLTHGNYQILNTDLGVSFRHKGTNYVLFGDSNFPGGNDAMGFTADADPEAGLKLAFEVDRYGNFAPIAIPNVLNGVFDVPIYGVSSGGNLYLYYATDSDAAHQMMGQTVVAVSTNDGASFAAPLYTLYSNAFVNVSVLRVNCADWSGLPQTNGLGFLIFGSGPYRLSDVFLAFQPESDLATGTHLSYLAGLTNRSPIWSTVATNAWPMANAIFTDGAGTHGVGELSATFNVYLKKWLLLYNSNTGKVFFKTADNPWGPWSNKGTSFDPTSDNAFNAYMYQAGGSNPNLCQPDVVGHNTNDSGGAYGPYVFNAFTLGNAGETSLQTTLYHTMSTWNPYSSVLMRTRLVRRHPPVIYTGIRSTNLITTAMAGGADAYVIAGTSANNNFGTNLTLGIRNNGYPAGSTTRKAWLRFPLNLPANQRITSASLSLTINTIATNLPTLTYNVYGLRASAAGQFWNETNLTWNNAPGNDTNDPCETDLNQTIFLGAFTTGTNRVAGQATDFSSLMLTDFLNQSSNGPVTFILSRVTMNGSAENFSTRENPTNAPPRLSYVTVGKLTDGWIYRNTNAVFNLNVDSPATNAGALTVTATSSNTNLVAGTNLMLTGNGASRTLVITPVINQIGTTTITLTASDGVATSDTMSFQLQVSPLVTLAPAVGQGALVWQINGDSGLDYILQTSSNLLDWQSLSTNAGAHTPFTISAPNPAASQRFYRVLLGP